MKILIVANTDGEGLPQQYPELANIASGNNPVILSGVVTMAMFEAALDTHQVEAVHVIGHGEDKVLKLADGLVTAAWLIRRLRRQANLQLVFLNACDSVAIGAEVHTSLHCVVVTQRPNVNDLAGMSFATNFYGAVARGANLQEAFYEARDSNDDVYPNELRPILLNGTGLSQAAFQAEMVANTQLLMQDIAATKVEVAHFDDRLIDMGHRITAEEATRNLKMLRLTIALLAMAFLGVLLILGVELLTRV